MRLLAHALAIFVSWSVASVIIGLVLGDEMTTSRYLIALAVGAVVAAAVYTALKDGPRSLVGILRARPRS